MPLPVADAGGPRTLPCGGDVGGTNVTGWGLIVALLLALGCGTGDPAAQASSGERGFDGERAFRDLVDQVRIGSRPAGSPGAARTRELIRERLRQAGWRTRDHDFVAQPPTGEAVAMTNVIAEREGEREELILLGTHYDTKSIPGIRFLGANDGASGTAVLLELARELAARPLPFEVWLVFFDGEESFGENITAGDGLYGSRALADAMQADGSFERIATLILVDMVADADLNLAVDLNSSPALRRMLGAASEALGLDSIIDTGVNIRLVDDHTPFQRRGLAATLAVIDFQYGGVGSPGAYWHTALDDLDKVSAESLNSVGRLLVETLQRVERGLIEAERARDG